MTHQERSPEVPGLDPWGLRRVERLLETVEGVDSLKIVPDGQGGIDEVHVISSSGLGAKQIVRNIESALLAQFGLQIDHRKISIAQVRSQDLAALRREKAAAESAEEARAAGDRRVVLEGLHVDRRAGERVLCRVQLRNGDAVHDGQAQGPDHPKARLEVAAQAVLNALLKTTEGQLGFAIEGVAQIDLFGRRLVVAVIQGSARRTRCTLPGIAEVRDSIEEAVVLACLGATNRWIHEPT